MDYNSDNDGTVTVANVYDIAGYNYGPADYDITAHVERRAGAYELPLGRTRVVRRLAGERHRATGARATRSPSAQTAGILSTTTGGPATART